MGYVPLDTSQTKSRNVSFFQPIKIKSINDSYEPLNSKRKYFLFCLLGVETGCFTIGNTSRIATSVGEVNCTGRPPSSCFRNQTLDIY